MIFKALLVILLGAGLLTGIALIIYKITQKEDDDFLIRYGTRFNLYNKNDYKNGTGSI